MARGPQWPATDLYTLRAVVEPDLALDTDVRVDAAHAVVSDVADRAFGGGWQFGCTRALEAEGVTDPRRVLEFDHVAEGVLTRLHAWMREDEAARTRRRSSSSGRPTRPASAPGGSSSAVPCAADGRAPSRPRCTPAGRGSPGAVVVAGCGRDWVSDPSRRVRPSGRTMEGMALDRAARLDAAVERDGPTCIWCGRVLTGRVTATTEHVVPRVKGGPSWLENEVAACGRCNGERGHTAPVEWLEECLRRGWPADEARLARVLGELSAAIAVRGGQRRARPYLDGQLRRLRRRGSAAA